MILPLLPQSQEDQFRFNADLLKIIEGLQKENDELKKRVKTLESS